MKSLVDERFEFSALVFRLAGRPEFGETGTDYQQGVAEVFSKFTEHPAVRLAKSFDIERTNGIFVGYDAVAKFAVHIEKYEGEFVFIQDISSLFDAGRWNEKAAKEFLPLFNDLYTAADYNNYFNSKLPYFNGMTEGFAARSSVDLEWFGRYVEPSGLHCILSPSMTRFCYSATVNDRIVYCFVTENSTASTLVHEFCHSFGNPLANKWYNENEMFRKWCDDTVSLENMPYYDNGFTISGEYVTRAYSVLYNVEHGAGLYESLARERNHNYENSFPYIEDVYNLILSHHEVNK